ncbi:hypothetical protein [Phytohalomonas tamaricis]|uniref:hypothetical protein n=1 Tax=Phytohalomonas tamaricis TaxID=2081032 RepID=UPI000D0B986A|nr:hypothetical protein [Phytohalomonas tamaricis]
MIDESNPAGRLHKILVSAKRFPDQKKVREVWATVLAVDSDDAIVTKAVVELYSLSHEIQSLIKMNDQLNHELYLASFVGIDKALIPLNLGTNWQVVKVHLTDEALTRLQFCAEELSRFYAEESLSEDELNEVIQKTEALFDAVYSSSLPDSLRLSLLEEVERLRSAITMYRIKGAKGLKEALQGTIGAVVVNQDELKLVSKDNYEVIKRLGELIDKMDAFTARALKIKKLVNQPIRYLLKRASEPDQEPFNDEDQATEA